MPNPILQAQPPLEFIPPALNPLVVRLAYSVLPLWMRSQTAITEVKAENVETLVDLYRQFQAGKIRFLMAFRHPSIDDPLCMAYLLSHIVPKVAQTQGISLSQLIHSYFMYDRGIPLWAGSFVSWLYSRLGGTPIHRGKVDRVGLRSARDLFANGLFPIAAAPEGATNGHNEIMSPLEPGIAQLGFWCVEDLLKAERSEQVFILPIGIQYHYVQPPWQAIEKLLSQLEADSGLSTNMPTSDPINQESLYRRLYQLGEHLLSLMEEFYAKFYHQEIKSGSIDTSVIQTSEPVGEQIPTTNKQFYTRLNTLLNSALQVAEQYFNIQPKGNFIDRCRRLEQAGWDYIYREDLKNVDALSPLEKGLADRIAEEASLRMWHMRLVESFVAVTGSYVLEKPTAERFADTSLLMWDMINKIKGSSPLNRPRLGQRWVKMTIGQPISVSDRWESYQGSRRAAKQALNNLNQDLQTALETMIN